MEGSLLLDRAPPIPRIGAYDLIAEIGRVGMADLFFALAPPSGGHRSRVVLKRLRSEDVEDEDLATFLDEARLARRLRHPNVIETIEVGRDGRSYFIAMEFLDGQPLSRIRKHERSKPCPLSLELRIISDVLAGLHYLHEVEDDEGAPLDVVHCDVSPHNVFVTYDGHVKITDFGAARASVRVAETRLGAMKGMISYLAPENVRSRRFDRSTDVFAAGVMLWEAATGRRFWEGLDEPTILRRLVSGELPTTDVADDLPPDLFEILKRALAPDPACRFATAGDMRRAVDELLADRPEGSTRALSAHVQRMFIEERRGFYQSARAAVSKLERRESAADRVTVRDAIPEPADVDLPRSLPPVVVSSASTDPLVDDGDLEREGTPTRPSVRTSFTSPSSIPRPDSAVPPSRRMFFIVGGIAALLVICVGLVRGSLHRHTVPAQNLHFEGHVAQDAVAPSSASRFAGTAQPNAVTSAAELAPLPSAKPPRPPVVPHPVMRRPGRSKSTLREDPFGI